MIQNDIIKKNKELCEKYPFLIPTNAFTGKVIDDYDYSYTLLDQINDGWRIAFGEKLCQELKEALDKDNSLNTFKFIQIKEKYGSLRLYHVGGNNESSDIIYKYEELSKFICIKCGKPATKVTTGWIYPYCDKCADIYARDNYIADIYDFYKNPF